MSAGVTPLSRGAGECRDSPAARRTEGPPRGVPGPHRTPPCGVGRCSRLGPVLRDGSFPPPPPSTPRVPSGLGVRFVRSSSLASLQGRSFPSLPVRDWSLPPSASLQGRVPRAVLPVTSSGTSALPFGAESFLLAFSQDRGHPLPPSSPQDWVLSLRPLSPQGRFLFLLPGARGSLHLRAPPLLPPAAPGDTRGQALLTAVPGTPARVSGVTSRGDRRVKDCSLLTPAQCGSSRCRWDISTFQASAVGAAAGKKPQRQLSSELRDQCKRYASSSSSFPCLLIQVPAWRGGQSTAWER